jgi:acetyl esterase/lipase
LLLGLAAGTAPARLPAADPAPPAGPFVYKTIGERRLQLAMHYPPGWKSADQRTAIVFFSGAHKVQADKDGKLPPLAAERAKLGLPVINRGPGGEHHVPICDAFAQRGYVVLRVEYRTRGKDGVLPGEDIADAFSAMRWVRGHAASLGVAPDRIVAAGGSSGAYLAASLFAFADRHPDPDRQLVSARPEAILLFSPLVDWLEVGSMSEAFLVVLGNDKELGARISPARHWRQDCPPTLVMVGSEEPPFATVKAFAEKWKAAGAPMTLFVAQGSEHGFFGKPAWVDKTVARTEEFLRQHNLAATGIAVPRGPPPGAAPPRTNQVYKTVGERKLQVAVHYPVGWKQADRRAALLCFEGGGENPKDKEGKPYPLAAERARLGLPVVNEGPGRGFVAVAEHFAGRGVVCIRAEYRKRKTDGVLPDKAVEDAKSAMRWVRAHAADLGVDAARVVATGASSGGHLTASLAALREFDAVTDDLAVSCLPHALILHSPLLDFVEGGTRTTPFLSALDNDRELGERLSPARHWSRTMPPTLLFTGAKEPVHDMLREFARKWHDAGQRIELVAGEGGHVYSLNEKWLAATLARMEEFLARVGCLSAPASSPEPPAQPAAREAAALQPKLDAMLRQFPEADANRDGVLTPEEARAFRKKAKSRRQTPP